MSAAGPASAAIVTEIQQRLKDAGIVQAAIVDDTYDGITNETVKTTLKVFVDAMDDDNQLAELTKVCPQIDDASKIDLDVIRDLWAKEKQWSAALKPLADPLFVTHRERIDRLETIALGLEKIGLKVYRLPPSEDIPETVQLVFLDYQLEPAEGAQAAKVQAVELVSKGTAASASFSLAERIAANLAKRGDKRPFLVLISEWESLAQVQAEFRKRTNYLGGTFAFLAKSTAAQERALYFRLRCWGVGHPALPVIRNFFSTIADSLDDVARDFREALLELDVHDYSFIQRLSLTPDGEPLGEYVLQLISESLGHRLRNHGPVRSARLSLDQVLFKSHLPSTTLPSAAVTRLYREALTDRGEEALAPHPLQAYQVPPPAVSVLRVCQGDVFVTPDRKYAYVVINPGCDLQYSPVNPDRPPDPKLLLYLVQGTLIPFSEMRKPLSALRTEPFEIDGITYRISWDHKVVEPIPLGNLAEWCQNTKCRRVARLRELQAAALQQAWVANMGRIGLPVSPPYFSPADFQLYVKTTGDTLLAVGERIEGGVVLTQHWHGTKLVYSFTLTQDGVLALAAGFSAAAERFKESAAAIPAGPYQANKVASLETLAQQAVAAASFDISELFCLMEGEHELERKPGASWTPPSSISVPVHCFWQSEPAGKNWKTLKIPQPALLVLDILPPEPDPRVPIPAPATAPSANIERRRFLALLMAMANKPAAEA